MLIYFSATAPAGTPVLLHPSLVRWARMFKGL